MSVPFTRSECAFPNWKAERTALPAVSYATLLVMVQDAVGLGRVMGQLPGPGGWLCTTWRADEQCGM